MSKSAAAAGATATLVAPAAEEALGESAYFGLLALHAAAAAAEEGRPAKESADANLLQVARLPAAAAAASPHVAVAAARTARRSPRR